MMEQVMKTMLSPKILAFCAKLIRLALFVTSPLLTGALDAHGQSADSVRLIVPLAAGGPADSIARQLAERLQTQLKATVIVENRAGANGAIGAAYVANAEPDGHTLLFATSGLLTITPILDNSLTFNPDVGLTPIARAVVNGSALVVKSTAPYNNMSELLAYAHSRPQPLSLGSAGVGNITHLYIELLKVATKTNFLHVPYRGVGPAMIDVISGAIDGQFADLPAALPQIKGGMLKPIGLVGESRSAAAPDIPTIAEQGYPGVTGASWFGVFAPGAMDPARADALASKVGAALRDPGLVASLQSVGSEPSFLPRSEFAALIAHDRAQWAAIIRERNIKIEN
jgi:tripartite-type tricarboxylate transporter receptor subunit TctC